MSVHQKLTIPHACNAHLHIIDPAFPNDGKAVAQIGTVETYAKLADELGLERAVFVQAKPFATDNACLLDAIQKFGPQRARALAAYAPERMLWGTDFPHVTEKVKPDEWSLLETIDAWFDTDHAKRLALVENSEQVYGFSAD